MGHPASPAGSRRSAAWIPSPPSSGSPTCLDRVLAPSRTGCRPTCGPPTWSAASPAERARASATATAPSPSCPASARRRRRSSPRPSTAGPIPYLDELEATTVIATTEPDAAALRAALKGDCHTHSTWSDGGASIETMARAAHGPRPRVHGAHRPLAPPHRRPRPRRPSGCAASSTRSPSSTSSWRRSASSPAWRSTSSSTAPSTSPRTCSPSSTSSSASVHSKLSMPAPEMTRRMVLAVASPHVDILGHCTGRKVPGRMRQVGQSDFAGRVGAELRRRDRLRRLRPVRHRGRDQLPARAPGPARRAARPRPRVGLHASPSTPTPTPRASSSGSRSGATRRPATASRPTTSSTRSRPTTWSPGPLRHADRVAFTPLCRRRPPSGR